MFAIAFSVAAMMSIASGHCRKAVCTSGVLRIHAVCAYRVDMAFKYPGGAERKPVVLYVWKVVFWL